MTQDVVKVGDVVAWADVPNGALSRWGTSMHSYVLRAGNRWWWVWPSKGKRQGGDGWPWTAPVMEDESVTIISLGLTGSETAADLRALAERFDIREHLDAATGDGAGGCWVANEEDFSLWLALPDWQEIKVAQVDDPTTSDDFGTVLDLAAQTLHAIGWRVDMKPSAAARLLAVKQSRNG